MRTLRLTEHQIKNELPLSNATAASLSALGLGISIRPSWNRSGHFDIRPGAHVGVIVQPAIQVVIEPKLPIDRVLFLISCGLDPRTMAARRRPVRDDRHARRRFGAPIPIELAFDEFTVHTDLNRVLKAALQTLSRLPIRSARVKQGLAACAAPFDSVTLAEYTSNALPALTWNRLNRHFEPAANLARMIRENASVELTAGQQRGAAFTIDMNMVFESFVRTALREALRLGRIAFPDRPLTLALDAAKRIGLVPDLTWWGGERSLFVGSVMYKRNAQDDFLHADISQLLAYAVALGLNDGLLGVY